MSKWYMLTLVGKDRPGIVAKVSAALFAGGGNLGEASMMRLGGNFSIMLMVNFDGSSRELTDLIAPVAESLGLHYHVDRIEGALHRHHVPDVRVTVYGADRAGIVAKVTGALAEAGLDITDLESDVAGTEEKPIYILQIEGMAREGVDALQSALDVVAAEGINVKLNSIETLFG